jgi:hypothetical protein
MMRGPKATFQRGRSPFRAASAIAFGASSVENAIPELDFDAVDVSDIAPEDIIPVV